MNRAVSVAGVVVGLVLGLVGFTLGAVGLTAMGDGTVLVLGGVVLLVAGLTLTAYSVVGRRKPRPDKAHSDLSRARTGS